MLTSNGRNFILNVDSYKISHYLQYPPETSHVSSYIESRGGPFKVALFFGLQMFLKEYLARPINAADIAEAADILPHHGLPFNEAGWQHILEAHGGYLPIEIEAVPEGTVLPIRNAMLQVVNTDPRCAWLTSYVETALLRAVWYPTTVATIAWHCRNVIRRYLEETADNITGIESRLHDVGSRGVTSEESAAIGGAAHLLSFTATDTLGAVLAARRYYAATMAGFAIPAAEHSTITSWGQGGELAAYENMLNQFCRPGKRVSVVSDSYNLWNAIENIWGEELKGKIESSGGTLLIRPDSGDVVNVVTETIERLMDRFDFEVNAKGYRVLPACVRVMQSDGISSQTIEAILAAMKLRMQSAENICFGMGGQLLQKANRDTMRFAMKASAVRVEGSWRDVFKDPVTDHGKRSKKGRLAVIQEPDGEVHTIRAQDLANRQNLLIPVFSNGRLLIDEDFATIRQRAARAAGLQMNEAQL